MTEPPSSYTAGVESTVYRGVLSEFLKEEFSSKEEAGLNPLYVVECFRSQAWKKHIAHFKS